MLSGLVSSCLLEEQAHDHNPSHAMLCSMSSQILPLAHEDHQPFIVVIMEAQRSPRDEEQRNPGRLAWFIDKIRPIPRSILPFRNLQKQVSKSPTFKMTGISKTAIDPKPVQDRPQQKFLNGFGFKVKQKSLPPNEIPTAGNSRSDGNQVESNGHTPITSQSIEPVAVKHSSHSGEASTSVNSSVESAAPVVSAPTDTASTGPPVVEGTPLKYVKKMAHDCYVDLAQPLSPGLEKAWHDKIYPWLESNLVHSMEDLNCISAELVMAGIRHDGSISPTILVMCRDLAQKESIEKLLKKCTVIPENVQRRILIFDILKCTSKNFTASPPSKRFLGRQIAVKIDGAHGANVLYANVAEVPPVSSDRHPVFCTIGGILLVNGTFYGLTTAHALAGSGDESQATPIETSGMQLGLLLYSHEGTNRVSRCHCSWPCCVRSMAQICPGRK